MKIPRKSRYYVILREKKIALLIFSLSCFKTIDLVIYDLTIK